MDERILISNEESGEDHGFEGPDNLDMDLTLRDPHMDVELRYAPGAAGPSCVDPMQEYFLPPEELSDIEEEHMRKRLYCIKCQRKLCSWILYVWIFVFVIGCFAAIVVVSVLVVGPYR